MELSIVVVDRVRPTASRIELGDRGPGGGGGGLPVHDAGSSTGQLFPRRRASNQRMVIGDVKACTERSTTRATVASAASPPRWRLVRVVHILKWSLSSMIRAHSSPVRFARSIARSSSVSGGVPIGKLGQTVSRASCSTAARSDRPRDEVDQELGAPLNQSAVVSLTTPPDRRLRHSRPTIHSRYRSGSTTAMLNGPCRRSATDPARSPDRFLRKPEPLLPQPVFGGLPDQRPARATEPAAHERLTERSADTLLH